MPDRDFAIVLRHLRRSLNGDSGLSDAQLLERFASIKDQAAFKLLVRRHERLVFGVCRRVLTDFHDAEDAFQATFLALARRGSGISSREAVAGWLYKVAYRTALVVRAKRARESARQGDLSTVDDIAGPSATHLSAEWREVRTIVDEEVNQLPTRFRLPIILCYFEGRTVDEVALLLDCPRGTVASRLTRARERLRGRLVKRGLAISTAALAAGLAQTGLAAAPGTLVQATVAAVGVWSAGGTGAAAKVIALTEEVVRAMTIKKLATIFVILISSTGVLFVGSAWGLHLYSGAAAEPGQQAVVPEKPQGQKKAEQKTPPAKEQADAKKPTVSKPEKREVPPFEFFRGRLEPSQVTDVLARVSGRLASIHCESGAGVKKGDLLFELDDTVFKDALAKAEINFTVAKTKVEQSEASLQRAVSLRESGGISAEEFDKARGAVPLDRAAMELAKLELDRARRELDSVKVKAPTDGKVGRILVNAGGAVSGDKTILATIMMLDPMYVSFEMDERNFVRYQKMLQDKQVQGLGSSLNISSPFDRNRFPHQGTLAFFDDQFNPKTGTITVRGKVPNLDGHFLPGMQVGIQMPIGKPQATLVVPGPAVGFAAAKPSYDNVPEPPPDAFLFLVNADNVVEFRKVQVGEYVGNMRIIEEGLGPDDWVIIDGRTGLSVGDRVEPRRK
jgi:RND family efflux transporter MFP subunit